MQIPSAPARLVAGRDAEFFRFLGQGSNEPDPVACVTVDEVVVGWVDHDADRSWLLPGEVNVGYNVFASHRGQGIASRAVQLLMHHLALTDQCRTVTLLIDPANSRSQAFAVRNGFERQDDLDGNPYYKRSVPALTYHRGDVTIRRRRRDDVEMDLSSRDDEHIRWLWRPSEIAQWDAMAPNERRTHTLSWLAVVSDSFGTGPRWTFSVDLMEATSAGVVEVNLASDHAPVGEANISYWVHPAFRRRGVSAVSVLLALQFLRDHTATRQAHIMIDPNNMASLTVATGVGAAVGATTVDRHGRTLIRHTLEV